MELTPLCELQISTTSDKCELGDNNICHFNLTQHLNFDSGKKLYIAVKDVRVPAMEQCIDFKFYYGNQRWTNTKG